MILPVQVVTGRERRTACGELCLFRETLDEKIGCRSDARIRLRLGFAFLIFGDVSSSHCKSFWGKGKRVSKARSVCKLAGAEF
jgi:hypothetical protein